MVPSITLADDGSDLILVVEYGPLFEGHHPRIELYRACPRPGRGLVRRAGIVSRTGAFAAVNRRNTGDAVVPPAPPPRYREQFIAVVACSPFLNDADL